MPETTPKLLLLALGAAVLIVCARRYSNAFWRWLDRQFHEDDLELVRYTSGVDGPIDLPHDPRPPADLEDRAE